MDVKATLETRKSSKGNDYECIVIKLTDDYEKVVFLDKAELALLKRVNDENKTTNPFEFK